MELIASAMDAYSNLEMQQAKTLLEQALAMADSLDPQTLAKVHVSMGVVWIGGFSDNVNGQNSFTAALCFDPEAKVDPLFSTPDIEMVFASAQGVATDETCAGIVGEPEGPVSTISPCGSHVPLVEQKKSYELPFYMQVPESMQQQLHKVVLHYSFDTETTFRRTELPPLGAGYGKVLTCEEGGLREAQPETVTYYIEGLDRNGNVVCGHGEEAEPLEVYMTEEVPPIPPIVGLKPKKCCDPGDVECLREVAGRDVGEACTMDSDCREGLTCSDSNFLCEVPTSGEDDKHKEEIIGPQRFYVNLTGGTGAGYMAQTVTIKKADFGDDDGENIPDPRSESGVIPDYPYGDPNNSEVGAIVVDDQKIQGMSWSGIPLRLALGFNVLPRLSIEATGRVDVFIVKNVAPMSCWEAAGGDLQSSALGGGECNLDHWNGEAMYGLSEEEIEQIAKYAVAQETTSDGRNVTRTTTSSQLAWLINARVRYKALVKGGFNLSLFGGMGYGHIQYRVPNTTGSDAYYPLPGMVNIELGLGFAYYFNRYIGLIFDVPIDFLVGDGFALNFDFNLGIGVGF